MARTAKTTARQRAEQARQARLRAERRARRVRTAWWAIAAGPALVVLLVLIKLAIPEPGGGSPTVLSPATVAALSVNPSTLDSVARGEGVTFPTRTQDQPMLTENDKPVVLYVGADYCPYCASQRWALVIALERFGDFTGLAASRSGGSPEPFPNTATLSFHGSSYTSEFLVFQGVEIADREGNPQDELTAQQQQLMATYNAPPYVPRAGSVPFVDFGNQFLQTGTSFSPEVLDGLNHDQIAAEITNNPNGPVARAMLGAANAFTAILCKLTEGQPSGVCTSPAATAYQAEVA
jgi:hypothetical protein